jgi:hypothetical protein
VFHFNLTSHTSPNYADEQNSPMVQLVQLLLWISQKPDVWDFTPPTGTWAEQTWAVLYNGLV